MPLTLPETRNLFFSLMDGNPAQGAALIAEALNAPTEIASLAGHWVSRADLRAAADEATPTKEVVKSIFSKPFHEFTATQYDPRLARIWLEWASRSSNAAYLRQFVLRENRVFGVFFLIVWVLSALVMIAAVAILVTGHRDLAVNVFIAMLLVAPLSLTALLWSIRLMNRKKNHLREVWNQHVQAHSPAVPR